MNQTVASTQRDRMAGRTSVIIMGGVLVLALITVQSVKTWIDWTAQQRTTLSVDYGPGDIISVMLLGGQIYYGRFAGIDARYIQLKDVYYVQTFVDPATNNQGNRLVSRNKVDWHAPEVTVIALDKTMMVERVGRQSRLAQLIEQDKKTAVVP